MVLQRGRSNPIWGWDRPGQEIVLRVEGADVAAQRSVAGPDGRWQLECPALPAGGPYRLHLSGSAEQVIDDVLVGEVWLASGQSNMEWPLSMADSAAEAIAAAGDGQLRLFRVANTTAEAPQQELVGLWQPCEPEAAAGFSAVAYHFGQELRAALGVPVGLIQAAWGGTRVEAWTSAEALAEVMDLAADLRAYQGEGPDTAEQAAALARLAAWEREHLSADPGNRGFEEGWAAPGYDDSAWDSMPLPSLWQSHGLDHNGAVWFRRTVELPAHWRGRALTLALGPIDDFDTTYVDGVEVGAHPPGTPGAYAIPRHYSVPAALTDAERLVIAVRVFDQAGQGGFGGVPGALTLAPASAGPETGAPLRLDGPWRCRVEHAIPLVDPAVFASAPPLPRALQRQNRAAALFNAMIAPLVSYGLRGAIWYQGESNAEEYPSYEARFRAMIRDWRARWGEPQLAFLFVQLAAFGGGPGWPELRAAQAAALAEPDTGMALAIDIGHPTDVHPGNKREVGRRLALIARAQVYGQTVAWGGPVLRTVERTGGALALEFDRAEGLRTADGGPPTGLELIGPDGQAHAAQAHIEGTRLLVALAGTPAAAELRYAWADFPTCNLVNAAGLPAEPFRVRIE
ncbi:MAG TPA: sialate O-acetylesterase [Roseiflexaceae bacterium]|nr:sialate O-acetylesterase [Roseiflexaceae bacterium]